jgi:pimeloyl-ACP methyl ester carboxylesterase
MAVEVHGDGARPPMLLAHGMLSSRAQWKPNLAALGEAVTPVVVELLGHGRSDSPEDAAAYEVGAYIERFEALRRELGAERWFVCGQSFGAGLTLQYALAHPDRVIAQVFTNSMSGLSTAPAPPLEARAGRAEAIRARGRAGLEAMPIYPRPSKRLAPELWEDLVADAALLNVDGVAASIAITAAQASAAAGFARTAAPTLLVNGTREAAFQPVRDWAAAQLPALEIVDLPGGHSVNLDTAAGFNTAVLGFVRRFI